MNGPAAWPASRGEAFLRAFHARHPGATSAALGASGSYDALAVCVPAGARVLDLGCGDGLLLDLLAARGARAVGVDLSRDELVLARRRGAAVAQGRAQELPFAGASFDAVVAHLVLMLLDELDAAVAEIARVLAPGGRLVAVLGGGPTAGGDDAFHRFTAALATRLAATPAPPPALGDRRASSEAGWRALFPGWDVRFERRELDLSGPLADVWRFLGASYQLVDGDALRAELRAAFPRDPVPCRVVTWLATATRPV
jgi:SAM-dependent methyltransferase